MTAFGGKPVAVHRFSTTCSGCSAPLLVDESAGTVTARHKPARHIAAHDVTAEVTVGEDLLTWDCPIPTCGYPDSFDVHYGER